MVMIRAMEGLAVAERWWWQEKTHTPLAIRATEGGVVDSHDQSCV